jgi:two-component system, sensor histidine kinase and response regulator
MEKPTVLVVDDEPNNIKLVRQILENNFRIRIATNGKEALERVSIDPKPDLILLDIMMPGMDGYDVCQQIKANLCTKDIPIIFLTAKTESDDIVKGFEKGAVDYLFKPFNRKELVARVNTHVELKQSREKILIQNKALIEAVAIREDVDQIIRHDLKAPLNAILGYPQLLLQKETLTEKEKRYIHNIQKAGTRMLNMIDLSLDLFKMERGHYQLKAVSVDLLKVIEEVSKGLDQLKNIQNVNVEITDAGLAIKKDKKMSVLADELLCYTMLTNLLKNAIEASPVGGKVTVNLDQKESLIIRIHNENTVPENIQEDFFKKYVTYGKNTGTGLGTYSAKLITEAQNGKIKMETSDHVGTTIFIEFPCYSS